MLLISQIWNLKTNECVNSYKSTAIAGSSTIEIAVNAIHLMPAGDSKGPDHFLICTRSNTLSIMNLSGQVKILFSTNPVLLDSSYFYQIVKTFTNAVAEGGDFITCVLSPRAEFIYAVGEDRKLYCFNAFTCKMEQLIELGEKMVIGIAHHPKRNMIATYSEDGLVKLWRP